MSATNASPKLAPLRTRLIVFAVLAILALASIWLIDRRAIIRMEQYQQQRQITNGHSGTNGSTVNASTEDQAVAIQTATKYLRTHFPDSAEGVEVVVPPEFEDGRWLVYFSPKNRMQLGGDFQVFVDKQSGQVDQVLRGQ